MAWPVLAKVLGGGDVAAAVGKGVGNVMDRFWPKKLSEAEKFDKVKAIAEIGLKESGMEIEDVNTARQMAMTEMSTQKAPWIARLLNTTFRPIAGFMALFYLTDKFWSQVIIVIKPDFVWTLITRDPVTDLMMSGIIGFFFGFRQRTKEKGLTRIS